MDAARQHPVELENRRGRKVTVGSNPTPSAKLKFNALALEKHHAAYQTH